MSRWRNSRLPSGDNATNMTLDRHRVELQEGILCHRRGTAGTTWCGEPERNLQLVGATRCSSACRLMEARMSFETIASAKKCGIKKILS